MEFFTIWVRSNVSIPFSYSKNNAGAIPDKIIVYRDGVSEGQIRYVKETEIANIKTVFKNLKVQPKFAFIIVNKRINSRFYARKGTDYGNPPAGTVIDDTVTLPERYDFFVIPQNVRQGTVNPTSYNCIEVFISIELNGAMLT